MITHQIRELEAEIVRLRTQADLALVIPGQFSVYQWLLLQGQEPPRGGAIGNLSGQCQRLAISRGESIGEVKNIDHCGQRIRLCRTAKTYSEEILAEICGRAAA